MKHTPLKRSTKPIKRVSDRRRKVNAERLKRQEEAWGPRRWWRCWFRDRPAELALAGPCFGPVAGHEILSRAQAGRTDENLLDVDGQLPMCAHHNEWIAEHKKEAEHLGLRRSWRSEQ